MPREAPRRQRLQVAVYVDTLDSRTAKRNEKRSHGCLRFCLLRGFRMEHVRVMCMTETPPELTHFRDPVHGLIVFRDDPVDQLAWRLLNTSEFQRLRRIKQLGEVAPVSWTPERWNFRSPRWQGSGHRMRRSSAGR